MAHPHPSHRLAPGGKRCSEWLAPLLDGTLGREGITYRALAAALRTAITTDQIPGGARLPAQRELALLLGVGRTTVVSAYNLLRGEALIRMTRGAGTWVADRPARRP